MSVKGAQLYWVECDGCGRRPEDDYVEMVHATRADAIEDALGGDWYKVGRYQHACGNCIGWDENDNAFIKPRPQLPNDRKDES
jgi:hypothetical protein